MNLDIVLSDWRILRAGPFLGGRTITPSLALPTSFNNNNYKADVF